jgi:hypothetical protein
LQRHAGDQSRRFKRWAADPLRDRRTSVLAHGQLDGRGYGYDHKVRSELAAAYVAFRRISRSDVAGFVPGGVYYAYDHATSTYWALASFVPSRTAPMKVLVSFQDGGDTGLFIKAGPGGWQVQRGAEPVYCVEVKFFPRAVLKAWALPTKAPRGVDC